MQPQATALGENKGQTQRQGKICLKVPYKRMSQAMQQINRSGGKISKITPLNGQETLEALQSKLLSPIEPPWWIEISTAQPHCLYYFGPFESREEAQIHQPGYLEDLQGEGAGEITAEIKQCQPQILTQEW